jgi:geranylgeranyl reductase family protein
MPSCDVLIIGGGPAGSTCGWKLRQAGLDVLLLDRKTFPRDKTCAGWVTLEVVEVLGLDLEDYARERTLQPITGFRTGLIGGKTVDTHYDHPVSYGIRRCEFDHYLLQRSGVRTILGTPFKSMARRAAGASPLNAASTWLVNGEIETSLIIGAGGHFCPVARQLGAREIEGSSVVAAQEIEFEARDDELARCSAKPEVPELYFCPDLKGYGWCFRKGRFLNIGLGRTDPGRLSEHVAEFCEFLRSTGSVMCDIPQKFHGHAYQLYERVEPKLVDDGVLLIGDAAGLAYPQSGEGIRPAIESGLLAAVVIAAAGGKYSSSELRPYADRVQARFGRPRTASAGHWLPASWLQFMASRLLVSRSFARKVVIDRWFLHRQQGVLSV